MLSLRPYQTQVLDELKHLSSIGLFLGTGTGKTITSLTRFKSNPTDHLLVICPHNVLTQWEAVINEHFSELTVLKFKKSCSAAQKDEDIKRSHNKVIIVNFEILAKLKSLKSKLNDNWTIIVDESHRIKSVGTSRSPVKATIAALELAKKVTYKIIMTATPTQGKYGGYIDYYSQLQFLGYINMSIEQFKYKYVVEKDQAIRGLPYPIKVIAGYNNTDDLDDKLKMCARYYKSKFGDFEPEHTKINITRAKKYARTERERVYNDILMTNISRKRIGLKTMCTGTITGMNEFNERFIYEDNTNKIDWLREFLKDTNETVAIYYQYNVELASLEKLLKKLGKSYIKINGKTKDKYSEINTKEYDVMLGQFQAASESLDGLQHKCHIMVMFSMPESSLLYKQSLGRINRDGQEQVPMYYYLVMQKTIDADIYDMIEKKIEFSEETLNKLLIKEATK